MEKFETPEVAHLSYFFHRNLANEQISICPQAIAYCPRPNVSLSGSPRPCRSCLAESTVQSSRISYLHFNELNHHSVGVDLRWAIGADSLEVDSAKPL